ncbi:MAG TPA: TonB-dependent receptor [Hyphomonadaceae bacterium]|nr:TonB-dependent receptor [Hyphomonadaceae bacterium]
MSAIAMIALAAAASPALAQATDRDTVQIWGHLEETQAEDIADYGSQLEVITAEQIKNGGYEDASQALQNLVPGLYVAPKNGPFDYVNASLLGGRRVDIIWLVDGVRISNRLYTTTTPLDSIPAHMIDKIEVLKGGQSLFYGTSAISGVVNIITKGFSNDTKGELSLGAGSDEERQINGYVSGSIGNHHLVAYGSHDEAKGFQPFRDSDYQPSGTDRHRGYDVDTFGLKYGYEFSDSMKASVNYQHTDADVDFAQPFLVYREQNRRKEDILSAKLDWDVNDQFSLYVKGYYHWWHTHYDELDNHVPPDGSTDIVYDNAFWGFDDYGVNVLGQYKLSPNWTLLGGVDYQNYNGEDQVFLISHQTEYVVAPFAQVRYDAPVLKGLRLAAGVRHNAVKGDGDATVYNVSGDLQINDYLHARGQVGTSFRLPDAYELFVVDPCCEQGNPNLKGEESTNYELGLGGQGSWFSWELTGFRRKIKDLIQIITLVDTRAVGSPGNYGCSDDLVRGCYDTFDNNGSPVTAEGGELTMTAQLPNAISATFDWTHSKTEVDGTSGQIADTPKDTAKLIFDWSPADMPFGGGLTVNYVGDTVGRGVSYGNYTVLDLNARWYLTGDRKQRLNLRVENITDEDYVTGIGRGTLDAGGSYLYDNLGRGRSVFVNYTVAF